MDSTAPGHASSPTGHLTFRTHDQEGSHAMQVIDGYRTIDIVHIISNARTDTDLAQQQIVFLPFQRADHTLITSFCRFLSLIHI